MTVLKIKNSSQNPMPSQAYEGDAGFDIRAFLESPILLKPFERFLVPTGLFFELEDGYEAQVRPRSGLAIKHGITVLNSPGTIDSKYRGEIKVILINLSTDNFIISNDERIAQVVIQKVPSVKLEAVSELSDSERGTKGFGSSGLN